MFIFLFLLLEIALLIFIQFYLDDFLVQIGLLDENNPIAAAITILSYILFKIISFIVGLIIFFKIVNKEEDPEFKIPWIVGMLLLPFFTSIIYLIFGNHGLRKK